MRHGARQGVRQGARQGVRLGEMGQNKIILKNFNQVSNYLGTASQLQYRGQDRGQDRE